MASATAEAPLEAGPATPPPPLRTVVDPVADPVDSAEPDGHELAAEFDPVAAVWLSHGAGHEALTAGLVAALAPHVELKFLVRDAEAEAEARKLLASERLAPPRLRFMHEPLATFFLRDAAVFTRRPGGGIGVIDFVWSEYGTAAWCAGRHGAGSQAARSCAASADLSREALDRAIARHARARLFRSSVAIEGGGVESNGRGLLIANQALYATRNPGRSRADLEAALLRLPGVRRIVWLPAGLAEDPHLRSSIDAQHVAWGTGGHTDEFVRFADERTVLLAWPEDADVAASPVARLTRQRMQRNHDILARSADLQGRPLRVLRLPMPRLVQRRIFLSAGAETALSEGWTAGFFPPSERRREGQPVMQIATCSYLNHVVANGVVVAPDYLPQGTPAVLQERARRILESAYAGRQVRFVDASSANWVGGGLHCATLCEPGLPA